MEVLSSAALTLHVSNKIEIHKADIMGFPPLATASAILKHSSLCLFGISSISDLLTGGHQWFPKSVMHDRTGYSKISKHSFFHVLRRV